MYHEFPSLEDQAKMVTPFDEWTPGKITIPKPPTDIDHTEANVRNGLNGWADDVIKHGKDSYGNPFVDLGVDHSTPHLDEQRRARRQRTHANRNKFNQTSLEDAFKFGLEDVEWTETRTCSVNTDISIPPFKRLHDAALDFFYSRTHAWENIWTRSKWNNIRYTLGIKTEFPGLHWPGSGTNPQWYSMTHHARRSASKRQQEEFDNWEIGEICALVRCPELAVRGFIAMLRQHADSMWEPSSAIKTAEIFAALMGYLDFYEILTDDHIAPAFKRAVKLAKAGPRLLREAFKLEEEVDMGFNRASWTLVCGSYLQRDINWQSQPTGPVNVEENDEGNDWSTSDVTEPQMAMTSEQARDILAPLIGTSDVNSIRLLNYLAYGRRVVTAVIPPHKTDGPAFMSNFYRLRTIPASWTEDERWREPSPTHRAEMERYADAVEEMQEEDKENLALELEQDTIAEPAELDMWVDGKALDLEDDATWLIGMGLRARWAQIGVDEEHSWWIARLKDYVLPNIWRTPNSEREVAKTDPLAPYHQLHYARGGIAPADAVVGAAADAAANVAVNEPVNKTVALEEGDDDDDLPGVIGVENADETDDLLDEDEDGGFLDEDGVFTAVISQLDAADSDDEAVSVGAASAHGRPPTSTSATRVSSEPLKAAEVMSGSVSRNAVPRCVKCNLHPFRP
ncbi:hypothetical protein CcaverHIS002_0206730 [Cutaneotrichosporon cavernicola]|nr:hypothetical protein CcaverHIS002_0206730 [Cutaneotrichosporon cavernicola]BEI97085.1 hypothetical protein CcaverHIS631_0206740 [Cutaneotrichosporon cavernicola]BEJ04858.1 hypothetical protein CcaverHIS641_0206750 [Cutaneotrichosporon cavernicola]